MASETTAVNKLLDSNRRKELFSYAYIRAICARAGWSVDQHAVDVNSEDLTVSSREVPSFAIQAKCTENPIIEGSDLKFDLPVSDYNHLRKSTVVPRILVVMAVPDSIDSWIDQTLDQLVLRRCARWASLKGLPDTENVATVRVALPLGQVFSEATPKQILVDAGLWD